MLIIQQDSLILRDKCVDDFLNYDFVGGPFGSGPGEMNGGMNLRRVSSILRVYEE